MSRFSNLPPGVTDAMIDRQAEGDMNLPFKVFESAPMLPRFLAAFSHLDEAISFAIKHWNLNRIQKEITVRFKITDSKVVTFHSFKSWGE